MKLSLAVIVKDQKEDVDRIINGYSQYFDELCFAIDDEKVLKQYKTNDKLKFYKYDWGEEEKKDKALDFSRKRNFLADKITGNYYVRIDTDDEIGNPESIRQVAERAQRDNISIIYCYYNYSKDDWGNTNAAHWRETIIENTENLYWNKKIHENVLPKSTAQHKIDLSKDIRIEHRIDVKHAKESMKRNIGYLLREYNEDKENTDPRTLAYLGRTLFPIGELDNALFFLEQHIAKSGWDEDRYQSWCMISDILCKKGNYNQSKAAAFEALEEVPEFPDAYFKLHDICIEKKQWKKALEWGTMGFKKPIPETFTLTDPSSYTWRPALSMSFAYFQTGDFEKAAKMFNIAKKQVPTLGFIKQNEDLYRTALEQRRFMEHFVWIVEYVKQHDKTKLEHLVHAIPKELDENEVIIKLKRSILPPKKWGRKEIAIFCGQTSEEWSPLSAKTGIGGSEEAVINMSKELAHLGYKITVYNNCGEQEGKYNSIDYVNFYKFNKNDDFNIVISWRMNIFPLGVQAKRKIVWLHDIPRELDFDKETVKTFDKVVVLSKYHKSLLPEVIPEEKIFVSSNGIVPKDFNELSKISRNPNRIIYASSYNRGLEEMLTIWGDVKKEVPDAQLDIFYGWKVYDDFVNEGALNDNGFKDRMLKLMAQDGVTEHGRIGHKELLEEYAKSGIYAYYCTYAGEINCIALTKAIGCGCYPITNKFAVMGERNDAGDKTKDLEEFKKKLISNLKTKRDYKINKDYVDQNSWQKISRSWSENLL